MAYKTAKKKKLIFKALLEMFESIISNHYDMMWRPSQHLQEDGDIEQEQNRNDVL